MSPFIVKLIIKGIINLFSLCVSIRIKAILLVKLGLLCVFWEIYLIGLEVDSFIWVSISLVCISVFGFQWNRISVNFGELKKFLSWVLIFTFSFSCLPIFYKWFPDIHNIRSHLSIFSKNGPHLLLYYYQAVYCITMS